MELATKPVMHTSVGVKLRPLTPERQGNQGIEGNLRGVGAEGGMQGWSCVVWTRRVSCVVWLQRVGRKGGPVWCGYRGWDARVVLRRARRPMSPQGPHGTEPGLTHLPEAPSLMAGSRSREPSPGWEAAPWLLAVVGTDQGSQSPASCTWAAPVL